MEVIGCARLKLCQCGKLNEPIPFPSKGEYVDE